MIYAMIIRMCEENGGVERRKEWALIILDRLHDSARIPLIQPIQYLDVGALNLPPKNIAVLLDAALRVAFWQRHPVLLQRIADQDLRGGFTVFGRERDEGWVLGFVVAD